MTGNTSKGIGRNVVLLGAVSALTDISSEMLYPIVPLFLTAELGASMAVVGLIEGVAEATASILKVGGGWFSDKARRRKPFILAGYALSAFSKPLMALAAAWPGALAARFVDRAGKGLRTAPRDALIAASASPERRGLAFGLHRAMDTAGAVAGPLLALALLAWGLSYRQLFVAAFIPAALGVLVLAALVREQPPAVEAAPPLAPPSLAALSPELKRLLFIYGIFALGNSSDVFLIMKAKSAAFSTREVLLAYVAYNIIYASASTHAGGLSDRIGRSRTLAGGLGVFACVYLGFAQAASRPALWSLFMLYGLYAAMTDGVAKALVADLSAPEQRGSAMGIFQGLTGALALIASAAAGLLWTKVSPRAPFFMGALAAAMAAALLILTPPARRPARP